MFYKSLYPILLLALLLGGCTTFQDAAPPTPQEISIVSKAGVYIGLKEKKASLKTAETVNTVFADLKVVLLATLKENPEALEDTQLSSITNLTEEYADLIEPTVQILLARIRPLIDQGKTDLAAQYIEATLDGAMAGVAKYKGGLADANWLNEMFVHL